MNQDRDLLLNNSASAHDYENQVLVDNATNEYTESPKRLPQYVAAIAATLSALAAGAVLGWTSPILDELESGSFRNIKVNINQMGWIGSFVTLGGMTMCIPTGFICDLIGRRRTLLLLVVPFTAGWLLIIFARSVLMLYFGRLFTGMAAGAACVAAPLYNGEISHKSVRGSIGSFFQLMVTVGIFLAYLIGKYCSIYNFTIICSTFPVIFFAFFYFQPETPVYLLKRGMYEEAKLSLIKLRGSSYDIDNELQEIEGCLKDTTQTAVSLSQMLRKKSTVKGIIICFTLMFLQQLSGINTIILYASDIFKESGANFNPKTASLLVGLFQVIATLQAALTIDRLGRRFLLIFSAIFLSISSFCLALFFTLKDRLDLNADILKTLGFLPVGSVCTFVIVFSLGFGPIPWMISSEILTPEIRSVVSSTAGTFNWFLAFLVTKFFLQVNDLVGEDTTFYVFSSISLLGFFFVYFFIPETKGKSIAEIQEMFEN